MSLNESVLEMHFHASLMELFRETFGLGDGGAINFYKYSPQKENFIGFDQAYIKSELSDDDLFAAFRRSAMNNDYVLSNFYFGYFLQFKVVHKMANKNKYTPSQIKTKPFYRSTIDTIRKDKDYSQHELLYKLKSNHGAMVYYACPMIFDKAELYERCPNLEKLRLVDVATAPSDYKDNEKHYIYFSDQNGVPIWCSDPVEGKAFSPKQFAESIRESARSNTFWDNQKSMIEYLSKRKATEESMAYFFERRKNPLLDILSEQLTIVHVKRSK